MGSAAVRRGCGVGSRGAGRASATVVGALLFGCVAPGRQPRTESDAPDIPPRVAASFPAGWKYSARSQVQFEPHAIVVSNSEIASRAGSEIMRDGGNAVDAAVATAFALAVAYPEAGNIGGGGFMVIRMADGKTAALDFREVAPLAATRDMYVATDGKPANTSVVGPLASGVPGTVAGMAEALRKWGTMPISRVLAPAIRLADQGFVVDSSFAASVAAARRLIGSFSGKSVFMPSGAPPRPGSIFRQPALARTLRAIARDGPDAFYTGVIAEEIAAQMKRDGGLITRKDLSAYRPVWRAPLTSSYRGYSLIMMPPSSSGGVTMGETFNILEALDSVPPFGSARDLHFLASAYQRAFLDRNSALGDPAFVRMPVAHLIDKGYARALAAGISAEHSTPTRTLEAAMPEGTQTTHYSVVDARGNAVAVTTTLNELYGSGVYVDAAGFFLNDEMDDFTTQVGVPNAYQLVQGEANAIAPGKRMLSAMSPTIVLDRAGQLLLVLGARGGPRIITSVSQVIRNVLDRRMSLEDALDAPRIHYQALPDSIRYDDGGFGAATIAELSRMGYSSHPVANIGASVTAIMRVKGGYQGMADRRSTGGAAGF